MMEEGRRGATDWTETVGEAWGDSQETKMITSQMVPGGSSARPCWLCTQACRKNKISPNGTKTREPPEDVSHKMTADATCVDAGILGDESCMYVDLP
jgi:hypothetical protein